MRASASVMYLPSVVLPCQRSRSQWNTLVAVFTQTIPLAGAALATLGAAGGVGVLAGTANPAVTRGVIASIVVVGTPALDRSLTTC